MKNNKLNKIEILRFLPAIIYYALICYVSSLSLNINISNFDKTAHTAEYLILGFLLAFAFNLSEFRQKQKLLAVIFIGVLLGVIDEIHQYFVPGRCMDFVDLLADTTGITLGLLNFILLKPIFEKNKSLFSKFMEKISN